MFKNLIVIIILSIGFNSSAQYKTWSLEASYGANNISDQSAVIRSNEYLSHFEGLVRHNFSPTFGVGAYLGYSSLNLSDFNSNPIDVDFFRGNISAIIDVFDIVDMRNDTFTILAHSGPGVSYIDNGLDDQYMFNLSSGITGLFKLSNNVALKIDYTLTAQFDQNKTLDGVFTTRNTQSNSFVNNLSVGVAFYLNNKAEDEVHADWYVPEKSADTVYVKTETVIKERVLVAPTEVVSEKDTYIINENVFFDHDSDVINESGLNALAKAIEIVNDDNEILLIGYASATESSDEYNLELSKRRAENVKRKLVLGGANPDRIKIEFRGKDYSKTEEVHDLARTVKIIVK